MNKPMPPTPLRQEDYLAIEAAVMETARGRWFLAEYARRNRNSDTDTLLAAIDKLEKTVVKERAPSSLMHRVKIDLADMAAAIEKTKQEIAQIKHEDNDGAERFERASIELDAIVSQTEAATGDILGAAEKIQEYAWTLREKGADETECDSLDIEATNIYMACSFQDLTGQRIKKIVDAMRYVETRINSMIDIWGFESQAVEVDANDIKSSDERPDAHLLNGPALEGEGMEQHHVDNLMDHQQDNAASNQDDVDALFDTAADGGSASADFSNDFDFDQLEIDETDAPVVEQEGEAVAEEAPEQAVDAVADETALDVVDLDDLDWAEIDGEADASVAETDMADDAEEEALGAEAVMSSMDDEMAADIFASGSSSDDVQEAEAEAAADIFATETAIEPMVAETGFEENEALEADIFAAAKPEDPQDKDFSAVEAAMQENLQELEEDAVPAMELRDRVAQFS